MDGTEASIEVSITINAAPAKVFEAWTTPALLEQWQTQRAKVDLRVGGAFRYETDDVEDAPGLHVVTGEYLELVPNEKIVSRWRYEAPDEGDEDIDSVVTVLFKAVDGETEVTVIEASDTLEDEDEADFSIEAWAGALEELADLLE